MFIVCDNVENEGGKVPEICYTLIQNLGEKDFKLKNDLREYSNQTNQLKLKLSAARFFDINLGLSISIFGSVFTYIIVLMQIQNF